MNATRSTLARRALGLVAVPALLVGLAACGDDGDSAGGGFCDGAQDMDTDLAEVDATSPEGLADIASAMNELDPPAEIADDWDTMLGAFEAVADAGDDPAAAVDGMADPTEAIENVGNYLEDECGIEGAAS